MATTTTTTEATTSSSPSSSVTDNVPLIAGICSGAVVIIIIIITIGVCLHRRKIRDIKYRTRVEMANLERRVPGEHYEYNPEGVYYGDDKPTYYTDYVTEHSTQSAGSESSEEEVTGQHREYSYDANGYMIPA